MRDTWTHIGRLWTNGEPFLAVDAALHDAWQGLSNDEYDQIIGLGPQDTSIPVGTGRAILVGGDGEVRDDSRIEVFVAAGGVVAIVQAAGTARPGTPDTPPPAAPRPRRPAHQNHHPNRPGVNPQHAQQAPSSQTAQPVKGVRNDKEDHRHNMHDRVVSEPVLARR